MLLLVVNMQSKVLYSKYKIVFYNNYFLLTSYNVGTSELVLGVGQAVDSSQSSHTIVICHRYSSPQLGLASQD